MSTKAAYLQLFQYLFEIFNKENVNSLSALSNEHFLVALLKQIEPRIESYGKAFEITNENNFGIRYSNFLSIVEVLETYKASNPGKDNFRLTAKFSDIIKINDLLKESEEQLILLSEIIIFISAISSRKDHYFDIINELEEKYCTLYYQGVEKYIILGGGDDTINQSRLERSYIGIQQVNRIKEIYERQITNYIAVINEKEAKINELKNKNEQLENKLTDLDMRNKDKDKEIEMLKDDQKQNLLIQEKYYTESLSKEELTGQLNLKEGEIRDLKNEIKQTKKRHVDEVNSYKEKIEMLEDKLKDLNFKLEKLKHNKDPNRGDSKGEGYHKTSSNDKYREMYMKDKQNYQNNIEKLYKEIQFEKERYFKSEEEKKKIERKLNELTSEYETYKTVKENLNVNNIANIPSGSKLNNKFNLNSFSEDTESVLRDVNPPKLSMKEYNELKNEKMDLMKMYEDKKQEYDQMLKEKEELQNQNETNRMEIDRLNKKIKELENDENKKNTSKEKNCRDLERKLKESENKYKEAMAQNKKENDKLKNEIAANKNSYQKVIYDKDKYMNSYKTLLKEFEKYKSENKPKSSKVFKSSTLKENNQLLASNDSEISSLKSEIKKLKEQLTSKNEQIEQLKNDIAEKENNPDNDFYRRQLEEQKVRVNEEHKLISDSLYKLAVHFMSLKDDLQKKFNVNNNK